MRKRSLSVSIAVAGAMAAGLSLVSVQAAGAAPLAAGSKHTAAVKGNAAAAKKVDFNGDGYADTVASAPGGTAGGVKGAGYVTVVYGSADGADTAQRQVISRATDGIPGDANEGEGWGRYLAAGDFDGDGVTDLAVGSSQADSGVAVIHGVKGKGLGGADELTAKTGGKELAAGDVDGDGVDDLVTSRADDWGGIQVLHGPFQGGKPTRTENLKADVGDSDVRTFTVGDVTGDGIDDVFATYDFEEMSRKSQFFKGGKSGMSAGAEAQDAAVATIGDVNGDGYGDVVIRTVPGGVVEDLPYDHGTVKVLYGTANGPSADRTTTLTQNSPGVPGANEEGDEFGASLAAGDVNGDGYADIAVGVPGEDIGSGASGKNTGAVIQLFGAKGGLSGTGAKNYDQGTAGVPGAVEAEDGFGKAVSLGDTDGDGHDDLAVGAPGEDGTTAEKDAGAVWSLRGSDAGLTTDGVRSWGPAALGAPAAGAALGSGFPR
ncbi:FG-GAP and VCBS repeat-containing protein [Streptomyces albus]|uniref:FG-GAP and VCBS repeat-containing protein n=1 Tax=Streptomyces albus TaxID=1888 RepID=UPI0024ADB770|nr:FG-GAP and VCBS repeat-containing protein [Streptomyces albus]MDI6413583.1 FG-GAP and VCBS repeat-containing protein [Streptomyces albus]